MLCSHSLAGFTSEFSWHFAGSQEVLLSGFLCAVQLQVPAQLLGTDKWISLEDVSFPGHCCSFFAKAAWLWMPWNSVYSGTLLSTNKTEWNLRGKLQQLVIRLCRENFWNVMRVRHGYLMPHVGTEFDQLLGVASNNDLCWEKAKITVIWRSWSGARSGRWCCQAVI